MRVEGRPKNDEAKGKTTTFVITRRVPKYTRPKICGH